MDKILFLPSMALDALCFIRKCSDDKDWIPVWSNVNEDEIVNHPLFREQISQIEFFKYVSSIGKFNYTYDMSSMTLLFSIYTNNNLENMSLDDIIDIIKNADVLEKIVKQRLTDGFEASHIYPLIDKLKNGMSSDMIKILCQMKEKGFENHYRSRILPIINRNIALNKNIISEYDTEKLFAQIALLKNKSIISQTKVFVSFFSLPYAFSLYNGAFTICCTGNPTNDFFAATAHELMHGFADDELIKMYHSYIESDDYLSKMHEILHTQFGSGDEEEFVKAAEYYLCFLSGKYQKSELMTRAKSEYDGTCPISVILFYLLLQEKEIPTDYNCWLKSIFTENRMPKSSIKQFIERL